MKHIAITKQEFEGTTVNSVRARDLYSSLGLDKSQFARWSKKNIIDNVYALEGSDYIEIDIKSNGRQLNDYVLRLDLAKKLSLMARSEKGEEVRNYFIKVEKQFVSESNLQLDIQLKRIDALTEMAHNTADMLKAHNEIIFENTEDIKQVKSYIEDDKRNRPVSYEQQKALLDVKNRRVYEIAEDDKKLSNALHHKIWAKFKTNFNIPRYSALPASKFNDGIEYIKNVTIADLL